MTREIRDEISRILVKWGMPTRQVAISEIMALVEPQTTGRLRTPATQVAYKEALKTRTTFAFDKPLMEWQYWELHENEFPYDAIAVKHHLLVPKRSMPSRQLLQEEEVEEMEVILAKLSPDYDAWLVNFPRHQSVPGHFHIHLLEYK